MRYRSEINKDVLGEGDIDMQLRLYDAVKNDNRGNERKRVPRQQFSPGIRPYLKHYRQ